MNPTVEELKQSPSYRYIKELALLFDKHGINGAVIEIPMRAVMDAPLPDYLPLNQAVKAKFMFCMCIYMNGGHWGSMMDAVQGVGYMIGLVDEERK